MVRIGSEQRESLQPRNTRNTREAVTWLHGCMVTSWLRASVMVFTFNYFDLRLTTLIYLYWFGEATAHRRIAPARYRIRGAECGVGVSGQRSCFRFHNQSGPSTTGARPEGSMCLYLLRRREIDLARLARRFLELFFIG